MGRELSRRLGIALVVFGAMATTPALAQPPRPPGGGGMPPGPPPGHRGMPPPTDAMLLPMLLRGANLTAEQDARVRAITSARQATMRALLEQLRKAEDDIADRLFEKRMDLVTPTFNGLLLLVTLTSGIIGLAGALLLFPEQSNLFRLLMMAAFVIMSAIVSSAAPRAVTSTPPWRASASCATSCCRKAHAPRSTFARCSVPSSSRARPT